MPCERLVIVADPAYPPLHWYDGVKMQGASIAIAKRVLDDLKFSDGWIGLFKATWR